MKINNPQVTLADDARIGVKEEVRQGFLDWLMRFDVLGDDGEQYSLGGSILSMAVEKLDLVTLSVDHGQGSIRQLRNSIYKVGKFPGEMVKTRFFPNPQGTLKIEECGDHIVVKCGPQYTVECYENNSWHLMVDTCDGEYHADLWHRPEGLPLWYGRETPSPLTQHSITYGYNWAAPVDGTIWLQGKEIKVKGFGIRERYVAVDSSAAELGAWEDWGFIAFNEVHSSMYDMRAGMKDYSLYDLTTGKHYTSNGNLKGGDRDVTELEFIHEDWVFVREVDGFIPSTYRVLIKTEDGTYEMVAKAANVSPWGVTFKVPDNPVATITYKDVEGRFVANDGSVRELTGGCGCMSIRQWHQYPNILPRELYIDEQQQGGMKFDTL